MAELITMPKLGFDMAEGKLSEWLKKPGEAMNQGETILLVETDKATVEVPAFRAGVLLDILVQAGESVPIGTPVAVVGEQGEKYDPAALGVAGKGGAQAMPPQAEPKAEPVPAQQEKSSPATSAAATAPTAPPSIPAQAPAPAEAPQPEGDGRLMASPVAMRMAGELGIDLRQVKGSGPMGRIIKRDIETYVQEHAKAPKAAPPPPPMPTPSYEPTGAEYTIEPFSGLRQTIGRRMTEAKQTVPHFYVTMDIDMGAAMALRSQLNALLPETDKISVNDLIQKACAVALRQFPKINASWSPEGTRIQNQVNIGHAVARENGLVTAVVRDVDKKSLAQIARETRDLVGAYARGQDEAGRDGRRHVHHQQPGHVRGGRLHRDHQPAAGSDSGRGCGAEGPCGERRGADRGGPADEGDDLRGPPRDRRRRSGEVSCKR